MSLIQAKEEVLQIWDTNTEKGNSQEELEALQVEKDRHWVKVKKADLKDKVWERTMTVL